MKQFRRERIEFVGIIIYKMAMKQTWLIIDKYSYY
jgi:hypothetical protein